jgi:hypothetical protein
VFDESRAEAFCRRCGEVVVDFVLRTRPATVFDDSLDTRQNGPAYRAGAGVPGTTFWTSDRDAHGNRTDITPCSSFKRQD